MNDDPRLSPRASAVQSGKPFAPEPGESISVRTQTTRRERYLLALLVEHYEDNDNPCNYSASGYCSEHGSVARPCLWERTRDVLAEADLCD